MGKMYKYRQSAFVIFSLISLIMVCIACINKQNHKNASAKISFNQFAGSATCATCHKNIYDNYIHTAHYLTSQPATEKFIKGSFESGENSFAYSNNEVIAMEKRSDGFYQVQYYNGTEKDKWRFDIAIGSGALGQSTLSWRDNMLFQLPITYFTAANRWSNSTGYPDNAVFNRTISSRCLECHTTYAKTMSEQGEVPEKFDHNQIIYTVACEKCHGPGETHVKFHLQNLNQTKGRYITNPASFTKQQKLDLCALCHGGRLKKIKPSFEFISGDKLSDFFDIDTTTSYAANIDVHGNQLGLLRLSKCFILGKTMTCNTCHNLHENETGEIQILSEKCISCHNNSEHQKLCKLNNTIGPSIKNNCIDCHMPLKPSNVVQVFLPHSNNATSALIRTHYITIYPGETKKVLDLMKTSIVNSAP
jgi:nitrate/TMAO reductase-like tetraheme cytochrome c subunit